jgi:hypothetical protein
MTTHEIIMDSVERQRSYIADQESKGARLGIVFADAFVRGMREIGYKNPAWALAEMIDNAIQASATTVELRYGFSADNKSQDKPDQLAIIDQGNGMIPEMISYAVRWGGTDRENERRGFGRFGYGLPSAAVSMARRYSVYSKISEGQWFKVTVDLDQLSESVSDLEAVERLLQPKKAELPDWLLSSDGVIHLKESKSGTIVVLEDLDRLHRTRGWSTMRFLQSKLLQHLGVIYRNWLAETKIFVGGVAVQPVDPLFLMENARFYAETPVMAQNAMSDSKKRVSAFTHTTADGRTGTVRLRASILPPDFQLVDPKSYGKKGQKTNKRFDIMKDYNGFIIMREGRQIDVVRPDWTSFLIYDRNMKIEIDFDPTLDELFGITTAKQQIVIDDEMWEKLKQKGRESGGLIDLVKDIRGELNRMRVSLQAEAETREAREKDTPKHSEETMANIEKFKPRKPEPSREQVQEAEENIEKQAEKISRTTGEPKEEVKAELKKKTRKSSWHIEYDAIEEGPFYIPRRMGQQRWIIVNTAHPFYEKVYKRAPQVRSALELFLLVLGDTELDAKGEREAFYRSERNNWSQMLRHGLDQLLEDVDLLNAEASEAEAAAASAAA